VTAITVRYTSLSPVSGSARRSKIIIVMIESSIMETSSVSRAPTAIVTTTADGINIRILFAFGPRFGSPMVPSLCAELLDTVTQMKQRSINEHQLLQSLILAFYLGICLRLFLLFKKSRIEKITLMMRTEFLINLLSDFLSNVFKSY
jgi:hypothetical protein